MTDTLPDDPDAALVRDAVRGDIDAFEALVRRHQARVVTLARTLTGRADDAEDLAQEAFVRVYRSLGSFRGESAFRTWLFTVVINVAHTVRDRRRRERPVWEDSGTAEGEAFDVPDAEDVEARLVTRDALERALGAIPEDLRVAVTLRDVQGLEYREIADVTGAPIGTVESRIFRARQRLRVLLADARGRRGAS